MRVRCINMIICTIHACTQNEPQTDGKTGWQLLLAQRTGHKDTESLQESTEDHVLSSVSSLATSLWTEQHRQNEMQYPAAMKQHSLFNLYQNDGVSVVARSKSLKTAESRSFADILCQAAQGTWTATRGSIFENR